MSYAGTPAPEESNWHLDMETALGAMRDEAGSPTLQALADDFPLAAYHLHGLRSSLDGLWPTEDEGQRG